MANPLLSLGTSALMGGIPTAKIEGEMFKTLYGKSRLTNNLMLEFGFQKTLQKNVVGSAIQSEGYQSFANKFVTKTMTPTVIERSIGMVGVRTHCMNQ